METLSKKALLRIALKEIEESEIDHYKENYFLRTDINSLKDLVQPLLELIYKEIKQISKESSQQNQKVTNLLEAISHQVEVSNE